MNNTLPKITENQHIRLEKIGFYTDPLNLYLPKDELPYLSMVINWLETKYSILIITDMIGYEFTSYAKTETNQNIFWSGMKKTPVESKYQIVDKFLDHLELMTP